MRDENDFCKCGRWCPSDTKPAAKAEVSILDAIESVESAIQKYCDSLYTKDELMVVISAVAANYLNDRRKENQ